MNATPPRVDASDPRPDQAPIQTCPVPSRAAQRWRQLRWQIDKRILRRKTTLRKVQGFDFELDLKARGVSGTLAMRGIREFDHTVILKREVRAGMVCVDAGANLGYNTLLLARGTGPEGKVIAIEPDPRNLALLERNVARNGLRDRVEILAGGVGDRPGAATLHLAERTNLNTFAVDGDPPNASPTPSPHGTTETSIMTIDELIAARRTRLDFLRMDIEGFEVEALRGAMRALAEAPRDARILMEIHPERYGPHRDLGEVLERLFAMGFAGKLLVSSDRREGAAAKLGYTPAEYFQEGDVRRAAFAGVTGRDCIDLCTRQPKVVRYLLLEKR